MSALIRSPLNEKDNKMETQARKKSHSDIIIDTLRSGDTLRSAEIVARVSELTGKPAKIQDVASLMAKLSQRSDIGFFIDVKKTPRGKAYRLKPKAMVLSPEQMYDLTRKVGKTLYRLEQAVVDYPVLNDFVPAARWQQPKRIPAPPKQMLRDTADTKSAIADTFSQNHYAWAEGEDRVAVQFPKGVIRKMRTSEAVHLLRDLRTAIGASL